MLPTIPHHDIGEPGEAARLEGTPALLAAQQPDTVIDAGVVGELTLRVASVRGIGHRYDGTTRQDDVCVGVAGPAGEWLVAVVADGVSAGPKSHVAARVAVRLGVQLLQDALAVDPPEAVRWDQVVGTIAGHVLLQARKDAGDETLDPAGAAKVMATTVAFVIVPVHAPAGEPRTATVVPIGDTSVWVLRGGASWESVTHVKNEGEALASSRVFALPLLPSGPVLPLTAALGAADALFVVTDGIGDPLGSGAGDVGAALASVWAVPPNRYEFAAQVDFGRRSHTDDRTVVGIWPDQPAPVEPPPTSLVSAEPLPATVDLAPPPPPPPVADPPAPEPPAPSAPPGGAGEATPSVWSSPPGRTDDPGASVWEPSAWGFDAWPQDVGSAEAEGDGDDEPHDGPAWP